MSATRLIAIASVMVVFLLVECFVYRADISALHMGDALSLLVALGTVGLALVTLYLAGITRNLTVETAYAIRREEARHQDQFRPVCVQMSSGRPAAPGLRAAQGTVFINGSVKNIGSGPALEVTMTLTRPDLGRPVPAFIRIQSLAAGEESERNQAFSFTMQDRDRDGEVALLLHYSDVFGNRFYSRWLNEIEGWDIGRIPEDG